MKSPFPGMDPYLERHWLDVHSRLVVYLCDQLQPRLPESLRARIEERVFVETESGLERVIHPDVRVVRERRGTRGRPRGAGSLAIAEPLVLEVPWEPSTQRFIEIVDASTGNLVVTVIEIVSPSNKIPGEGRDLYLAKQREILEAKVNLVEIDLVRAGGHVVSVPRQRIAAQDRTPFLAAVRRGHRPARVEVYPVPLRERLPVIGIPLRRKDEDVPLDLQAALDLCYSNGGYEDLDYSADPSPPLAPEDAEWADRLLKKARRRKR